MRLPAFTDLQVAALGWDSKPFLHIIALILLGVSSYYRVDFAWGGGGGVVHFGLPEPSDPAATSGAGVVHFELGGSVPGAPM